VHLVRVAALCHKVTTVPFANGLASPFGTFETCGDDVARSGYGVGAVPVADIAKGLSLTDFSAANTRRDDKQTEFCFYPRHFFANGFATSRAHLMKS
jgi:hypothetical protein